MKPLPAAPLTPEDRDVWQWVRDHADPWPGLAINLSAAPAMHSDWRDAELMSWLSRMTVRHYEGLELPPEARLPLAHLWVRIDPEWPLGHYWIDLT